MLDKIVVYFMDNKLITTIIAAVLILGGIYTAPFSWESEWFNRSAIKVDAIPDLSENQQIVFTSWPGRSPQDVEDQITYPLSSMLLGIPGVKTVRANSMFGFSTISLIFDEGTEFYWSRSRILEKINTLPAGLIPDEVTPTLGPDATALGQVFWYTLEGRDEEGNETGGWNPEDLRSIQDFFIKQNLTAVQGVSEVASVGGFVREYQVELNPAALQQYDLSISDVADAIHRSNSDVGARTIEINRVEYMVRGIGGIKDLSDLENTLINSIDNIPIRIQDVGKIQFGPAERRGALDKNGVEAVGGVIVARYGANPMQVINSVKKKIAEISSGLPEKVIADGRVSKVTIVPFYDRSGLIRETLGTLEDALLLEILITIIVVLLMIANLRAGILVSVIIPVAVLTTFIAMRFTGIDANIVALSGIAIAIGTIVDVGIVLSENMLNHLPPENERSLNAVGKSVLVASKEVIPAIMTALLTTIVSFIPVFALQAAEGKLFHPLAYTKTFVLVASGLIAVVLLPLMGQLVLSQRKKTKNLSILLHTGIATFGLLLFFKNEYMIGLAVGLIGGIHIYALYKPEKIFHLKNVDLAAVIFLVSWLLVRKWMPLGPGTGFGFNLLFVAVIILLILGIFYFVIKHYSAILSFLLDRPKTTMIFPLVLIFTSLFIWRSTGEEFMPSLDEGSFLLMPTTMPHAGMAENRDILKKLDLAVASIPEVESVVGKLGRVESALDPAPTSMFENVILYKPEYILDKDGRRLRFEIDGEDHFLRDPDGKLIPDPDGEYYRQWRDEIETPDEIWNEIIAVASLPGVTSAPKLQPIETRLVMLQTGTRANLGIKILGNNLHRIQEFSSTLASLIKTVPGVRPATVYAERIVGKPYLNIRFNRSELNRHGISIDKAQKEFQLAVGGGPLSRTIEAREGYNISLRYPRELRNSPASIGRINIRSPIGYKIPLSEIATIEYELGPQSIRSENSFLISYITFDRDPDIAPVDLVQKIDGRIKEKIFDKEISVPSGITYQFTGAYENQVRASKRLAIVIPIVILIIFLILFMKFKRISTVLMVFSGIAVAFAGSFIMIWLYGQPWFLDLSLGQFTLGEVFQVQPVFLSVAVWVGFIALFGIATDDGVIMASYLDQVFTEEKPQSLKAIRKSILAAGSRRVRPCLMTTATTLLALLPVLTSTGKGGEVMIPMAIPIFGGMAIEIITLFVVPVLYSIREERKFLRSGGIR